MTKYKPLDLKCSGFDMKLNVWPFFLCFSFVLNLCLRSSLFLNSFPFLCLTLHPERLHLLWFFKRCRLLKYPWGNWDIKGLLSTTLALFGELILKHANFYLTAMLFSTSWSFTNSFSFCMQTTWTMSWWSEEKQGAGGGKGGGEYGPSSSARLHWEAAFVHEHIQPVKALQHFDQLS